MKKPAAKRKAVSVRAWAVVRQSAHVTHVSMTKRGAELSAYLGDTVRRCRVVGE